MIHPFTGAKLPVYVASYVLADYGPGALMGVPMHDERDCAFALENNLTLIQVIDGEEDEAEKGGTLVNSGEDFDGMSTVEGAKAIVKRLEEMGQGAWATEYRLRDWLVSRQRYWGCPIPVVFCNCEKNLGALGETRLPLELPEIGDSILRGGRPLANIPSFSKGKCPECGATVQREIDTLDTFIDSSWYFLRFLDPANQDEPVSKEKLKEWMPVDIYVGGMEHAIMHLLYARFVHKVICDDLGIQEAELREPFKELIVQGLVKGKTYKHLASGRYLTEAEAREEFKESEQQVEVTFEKMSKSKGNGLAPQGLAEEFGVDTLRSALMFGAPPEHDLNFDVKAVANTGQYLQRVRKMADRIG